MAIPTERLFDVVARQVQKMKETYLFLADRPQQLDAGDREMLTMIEKWARKIAGAVEGHGAEFDLYYKHRIVKRRHIGPRGRIADVVVGRDGDAFAKAVQSKSTVQAGHGAIDNYLRNALTQLTGENGEQPRAGDRPMILITIWDPDNPWPATQAPAQLPTVSVLEQNIISRLEDVIGSHLREKAMSGGFGQQVNHAQGFLASFPDVSGVQLQATNGGMLRPRATPELYAGPHKVKTLVVKLKWPLARMCRGEGGGGTRFVDGVTVVGTKVGSKFVFQVHKRQVSSPMAMSNLLT
jgi:hypothetical protein